MNRSENLNELFAALAKAQAGYTPATKNANNPHLRAKFGDLSELIRATRPALSANGLSVTQTAELSPELASVETVLGHSSGQWLSFVASATVEPGRGITPIQAAGAVITYLRRYGYAALVGVVAAEEPDVDNAEPNTPAYPKQPAVVPAAAAVAYMPQSQLDGLMPALVALIRAGKQTVESAAALYAQRGVPLSQDQIDQVNNAVDVS